MIFRFLKNRRRQKIRQKPFPREWLDTVEKLIPYFKVLPTEDRSELIDHMKVFLAEKSFQGCAGLVVTYEMKLVIAAQACILLLHRATNYFPQVASIYVYPHTYAVETHHQLADGTVEDGIEARVGESWRRGNVVLAWDTVLKGARDYHDGQNVVLHEFAHQLDGEDGVANGAPHLALNSQYTAWARVLGAEFIQLKKDFKNRHKSVMNTYGATNPAEFFAVATETFFEKPIQLLRRHPDLYAELKQFYAQDPATFAGI